jgi:CubicO group peptidase (beta-lactamase class C family)
VLTTGASLAGFSPLVAQLEAFAAGSSSKLKSEAPAERLIGDLQALVPKLLEETSVPGLSIAVIRDGKILWDQGFGVKSKATGAPVERDTVFEAASLSKPAFAYAALKLWEEGKLSLDRPLSEYLPEPFIPDEPRLKQITMRRVLSHSSGLPHGRPRGTPIKLRFTPGERFAYSATGFAYLQLVVERLTGEGLGTWMRDRLLKPFGMERSSFGWREEYAKSAAQGHWGDGKPGLSGNGRFRQATPEERQELLQAYPEAREPSAAAGLYTTAADYARFLIEMLQPKKDAYRLSERSVKEMLTPQIKVTDRIEWGLGWGIQHTAAGDAFWHWGDWGVFRNFAVAFREAKIGAVVLTNSLNGPKAYRELIPKAIGGEHPAFAWVRSYRP